MLVCLAPRSDISAWYLADGGERILKVWFFFYLKTYNVVNNKLLYSPESTGSTQPAGYPLRTSKMAVFVASCRYGAADNCRILKTGFHFQQVLRLGASVVPMGCMTHSVRILVCNIKSFFSNITEMVYFNSFVRWTHHATMSARCSPWSLTPERRT